MRLDAGRLLIELDETGRVVAATARARSDASFLTTVDLGACRVDGADQQWSTREVAVDADEVVVEATAGPLEAVLRHSVSTGWTTRLLVVNSGAAPLVVDRLQLAVRPAGGHRVSALVAGSRLCWAAQPADGDGPLLTARLGAGTVGRATVDGLEVGPLRLAPGQRYVTQLRWELLATPRSVVAGPGRDVLVTRTTYGVDEAVVLPQDPDAALVVPRGLGVDGVEEPVPAHEVLAPEPGRHRIELRSAEGDVRLDLSWVLPLTEQLGAWSGDLLAGPRTAAGVVTIDDVAQAVVLQAALGAGVVEDADAAADALDRHTARWLDRAEDEVSPADPIQVLYLLGEHGRTGDPDVLDLALRQESVLLTRAGAPPPGLGLAVLRTVLAGAAAGESVAPLVLQAVARVSGHAAALSADDALGATAAAAELELLLAVRPLLPDDHPAEQRLVALTRRLGAALGAGLPGRLVAPPPVSEHAHLVAVLAMLPEDGVPGVTRTWGEPPTLLAHRLTLEVLDRLTDGEVWPAAGWLALVPRHA